MKWVTFHLLVHLMSNSDDLCSTPVTDKPAAETFPSKQDLGTQTVKKQHSNTFQSTIILLPSPVDDKLVFVLGYIWTTLVVRVKPCIHTNSAGDGSSFLSGPQKMFSNKCGEQASSISAAHLHRCRQAYYGVPGTARASTQPLNVF